MVAFSAQASGRSEANGILPVTASQTATTGNSSKSSGAKPPAPRLKIVIRRLPPGLTESEFSTILSEEWKLGQGKVDYFRYNIGKDSKDPSKPSRPSRAYLHLTNESHIPTLSETVRQAVFEDAQNTFTHSCLIGPPSVEFAPYGRIPGGRRRVDARAGTIDQDPEFMAFLEGLANPVTPEKTGAEAIGDGTSGKQEKVTTTPLVQYLKDKKANKSKEAAVKAAKKQEAQIAKGKGAKESAASTEDTKKKGKEAKVGKLVEKAAKEAIKVLNRETLSKQAADSTGRKPEFSASESSTHPKLDLGRVPNRQRGSVIAAHIRMLQRDLGLSPAQAHRQVRRDTVDAQKAALATKAATETNDAATLISQPPTIPTAPKAIATQASSRRSRAKASSSNESGTSKGSSTAGPSTATPPTPVVLLKKTDTGPPPPATTTSTIQTGKLVPAASARKSQSTAAPSEGATQAFIKHANPSQGVTESLLTEAMEKFGTVSTVEIDKRKGFAYVDFVDAASLKNAMAANPIAVAQGTVQVMQRKGTALPPEKKPVHQPHQAPHIPNRGGRGGRGGIGGRRGGRGGGRGGNAVQAPTYAPTGPAVK
ncbi:putative regulator of nonsense transcripts 3A [Amylocarpus encephaloides]|uniref:Regulator of nonsense transcripts 3A n=1 Tax=Amylocarpus encephaloides TaxID=45428 RepID=A0A9P8C6Q6_9HELO|nr:putative regulator of nonsense transcripts 3A [Amylocarpus encephaloides]